MKDVKVNCLCDTKSEITQFYATGARKENRLRFDISVDDVVVMKISQS